MSLLNRDERAMAKWWQKSKVNMRDPNITQQEFDAGMRAWWWRQTDGQFVDPWSAFLAGWTKPACLQCDRRRRAMRPKIHREGIR